MRQAPLVLRGHLSSDAALVVHRLSDGLKVPWIYAATDSAQVIDVESWRDRPDELRVGDAMRFHALAADQLEAPVTALVNAARPNPASGVWLRADKGHKPVTDAQR
jgi:hypothetical protein